MTHPLRVLPPLLGIILLTACASTGGTPPPGDTPPHPPPPKVATEADPTPIFLERTKLGMEFVQGYVHFLAPPVKARGKLFLSYELTLQNDYDIDLTLTSIEVFSLGDRQKPIATFGADYFEEHLERKGMGEEGDLLILGGNEHATANLWFEVSPEALEAKHLYHRVTFEAQTPKGETRALPFELALTPLPSMAPLTLGLPFHPGRWFYGAESHRDAPTISEGRRTYPQRFALDWILLNDENAFVEGDMHLNESWLGYGEEILSVAGGTVIALKDGIPENVPLSEDAAVKINKDTIAGNHLLIEIAPGIRALYAHLIPGSLRVKVGDVVQEGQVIGLLGNSGSSDCPHLHFHLELGGKMPLAGEGIPYILPQFHDHLTLTSDDLSYALTEAKPFAPKGDNYVLRQGEFLFGNGIIEFN